MIEYTTKNGKMINLNPIPLKNREAFQKFKQIQKLSASIAEIDENSDEFSDVRFKIHDEFCLLCEMLNIPTDDLSEGDLGVIMHVFQVGELPGKPDSTSTKTN